MARGEAKRGFALRKGAGVTSSIFETMDILGASVSVLSQDELLKTVIGWAQQPGKRSISYVNSNSLNLATGMAELRTYLNRADVLYADGIGVVGAARFLYGARLTKMTGRAWLPQLLAYAQAQQLRIFLLGGKPGIAAAAAKKFEQMSPGLQIAGAHHGFWGEDADADILHAINESGAQILLIGLGTPKQELWLKQNRDKINVSICWTVGALFDYFTGEERPAPDWIDQIGFEWFWRLMMNPLGKWRRYLIGNPLFIARVIRQKSVMFWRGK
jgi:N-acetylglucosaminyldiphosphoundecaprenol N-acetyl-beta-D-mannosaminyltransferase